MTSLIPQSTTARFGVAGLFVAAAGLGIIAGRTHAWNQSVGGMTAAFGSGFVVVGVGLGIVILALVAFVSARIARAGPVPKLRVTALIIVGVALGFGAGFATAAATGGTYRPPIVLEAGGSVRIMLATSGLDFVPNVDAAASCRSVPDGRDVEGVGSLDLGELTVEGASGTLRGDISALHGEPGVSIVSLWIDGGDLPEGAFQPFWDGTAPMSAAGGTGGTVSFTNLRLSESPDPSLSAGPWPASLAGAIEWSCNAW